MRVAVVDDEDLARRRLKRLLLELDVEIVAEGQHGEDALKLATELELDVLFIDIDMPRMSGIEAAEGVMQTQGQLPLVVFCTAHDQYALSAFKVNASDYLLKPITRYDLQRVIQKCEGLLAMADGVSHHKDDTILVHVSNEMQKKNIDNFYSFQAIDKHIYANLISGETTHIDISLSHLEERFPDVLLRVHRSSLVNVRHISSMGREPDGRYYIRTGDSDQPLYVSRRHLSKVKKALRK